MLDLNLFFHCIHRHIDDTRKGFGQHATENVQGKLSTTALHDAAQHAQSILEQFVLAAQVQHGVWSASNYDGTKTTVKATDALGRKGSIQRVHWALVNRGTE
jgi:hypothetical protein